MLVRGSLVRMQHRTLRVERGAGPAPDTFASSASRTFLRLAQGRANSGVSLPAVSWRSKTLTIFSSSPTCLTRVSISSRAIVTVLPPFCIFILILSFWWLEETVGVLQLETYRTRVSVRSMPKECASMIASNHELRNCIAKRPGDPCLTCAKVETYTRHS